MAWAERLPSGRYRGVYRDGAGRRRSAGTFSHKPKAERAAATAESKARRSSWSDPDAGRRTWGDWCAEWWPSREVGPGTLKRDLTRRTKHLDPRWSDVPLRAITRHEVRSWAAQLRRQKLAPATVQRCVHLLSASLVAAVDAEVLEVNPAAGLKLPKGATAVERFLTRDEYDEVMDALPTTDDQLVFAVLCFTGLRFGELAGLHWDRLDLDRGLLRVVETYDEQVGTIAPLPKGKQTRLVPLPADLVAQLAERPRTKDCGVAHQTGRCRSGLVLTAERGGPLRVGNWESRVWKPAIELAGIGHARVHDCRHTYASWLLQAGVPLAEVGRLLGHQSSVTTQRYSHLADAPVVQILSALAGVSEPAPIVPHEVVDSESA